MRRPNSAVPIIKADVRIIKAKVDAIETRVGAIETRIKTIAADVVIIKGDFGKRLTENWIQRQRFVFHVDRSVESKKFPSLGSFAFLGIIVDSVRMSHGLGLRVNRV